MLIYLANNIENRRLFFLHCSQETLISSEVVLFTIALIVFAVKQIKAINGHWYLSHKTGKYPWDIDTVKKSILTV